MQYVYRGAKPPLVPTELAHLTLASSDSFVVTDTYYDTKDLQLRAAGCSLRIRAAANSVRAHITWKGPSKRRRGGGKRREEVELPLSSLPETSEDLIALLEKHDLLKVIRKAAGVTAELELSPIGRLRNERSTHTYVQGLHALELSWDRIEYPVGPAEMRIEVEVKSELAERYLDEADAVLRELFDTELAPIDHGKVSELCRRLYPELVSP